MNKIRISHGFEELSEKDKADNELEEIISALEPEKEEPKLWYSLVGSMSISTGEYASVPVSNVINNTRQVSPSQASYMIGSAGYVTPLPPNEPPPKFSNARFAKQYFSQTRNLIPAIISVAVLIYLMFSLASIL